MKTVFLIGDSIRMGYDRFVRGVLADEAAVYYPSENCRFAQYVLRYAHEWIEKECNPACVDVVHWNAGLWDVSRLYGEEPLLPIPHCPVCKFLGTHSPSHFPYVSECQANLCPHNTGCGGTIYAPRTIHALQ